MTPAQYRAAVNRLLAIAASQLVPMIRLVPNKASALQLGQWNDLVSAVFPLVINARRDITFLAQTMYADERRLQGVSNSATLPVFLPQPYEEKALSKALQPIKSKLDAGANVNVVAREAVAITERHMEDAGRQGIIAAARVDPEVSAFARVGTGTENCAFCTMLISRGPIYSSPQTALLGKKGEPFHNNCDCMVVPVANTDKWTGRDDYIKAKNIWQKSTQGLSGKDALIAFRKAIQDGTKKQETVAA